MSDSQTQTSIATTKVKRASKFLKTGAKVGVNYLKYHVNKTRKDDSKETLHKDNAAEIYETLSQLKGSALKVAQMMSMDSGVLPEAYSKQFEMAQYSAPPLSYPLVVKTFREYFKKTPNAIFDTFDKEASHAASIGQVHRAKKAAKTFAVKIQYPGVAESIKTDLKLVKPFAIYVLGVNKNDLKHYIDEVEQMLLRETRYDFELQQGQSISAACSHLENLAFPTYYPEYSTPKILTMDWVKGKHLGEFLETNPSQEVRDKIGQTLWNFYDFQIYKLKKVHADPHPGNFIFTPDGITHVIDFGCVKTFPADFSVIHIKLMLMDFKSEAEIESFFETCNFIHDDDKPADRKLLVKIFVSLIEALTEPFNKKGFDFGNDAYFKKLVDMGEEMSQIKVLKESKRPRGLKDALYLNRTYFGLYNILHKLKANISTQSLIQEE